MTFIKLTICRTKAILKLTNFENDQQENYIFGISVTFYTYGVPVFIFEKLCVRLAKDPPLPVKDALLGLSVTSGKVVEDI